MKDRSHARANRLGRKHVDRILQADDGIRARRIRRAHDRSRIARILHAIEHDDVHFLPHRKSRKTRAPLFQYKQNALRRIGIARLLIDFGRHLSERAAEGRKPRKDALCALLPRRLGCDEAKAHRPARLRRHLNEPHALGDDDAFFLPPPGILQARKPLDPLILCALDLFHRSSAEIIHIIRIIRTNVYFHDIVRRSYRKFPK